MTNHRIPKKIREMAAELVTAYPQPALQEAARNASLLVDCPECFQPAGERCLSGSTHIREMQAGVRVDRWMDDDERRAFFDEKRSRSRPPTLGVAHRDRTNAVLEHQGYERVGPLGQEMVVEIES